MHIGNETMGIRQSEPRKKKKAEDKRERGQRGKDKTVRMERRCMDCANSGVRTRVASATSCDGNKAKVLCPWTVND